MHSRDSNVDPERVRMCHWVVGLIKINTLIMGTPIFTVARNNFPCIITVTLLNTRLVPDQDVQFFYMRSHLSSLQSCALIFSANFSLFSHLNSGWHLYTKRTTLCYVTFLYTKIQTLRKRHDNLRYVLNTKIQTLCDMRFFIEFLKLAEKINSQLCSELK